MTCDADAKPLTLPTGLTARPWAHLYDRQWRKRRAEHLRRNPLCVFCQARGKVQVATVADHITPHRGDPILFRGPIQSLCAQCHSGRKAVFENSGHLVGHHADGSPVDPNHPWNARPDR